MTTSFSPPPLGIQAVLFAALARGGELTLDDVEKEVARVLPRRPRLSIEAYLYNSRGLIAKRSLKDDPRFYFRLTARGRRLYEKHRAVVAAAYELER